MIENDLKKFLKKHATKNNLCFHYKQYPKKVQLMISNVFNACWRMNLYNSQIIYMLDEAIKPFQKEKSKELFDDLVETN